MKVPIDLQNLVGKKELRYSLKTGYIGIAKTKARFLAGQSQLIFRLLRKGGTALKILSNDLIKAIVEQYVRDSIKRLDQSFYEEWDDSYPPPLADAKTFHSYVDSLDDIRDDLIANLNLGNFSMLENIVGDTIKKNGINEVDKHSLLYRKLCAEIHKAEIKLIPIEPKTYDV